LLRGQAGSVLLTLPAAFPAIPSGVGNKSSFDCHPCNEPGSGFPCCLGVFIESVQYAAGDADIYALHGVVEYGRINLHQRPYPTLVRLVSFAQ
jgi:hypothetical protein